MHTPLEFRHLVSVYKRAIACAKATELFDAYIGAAPVEAAETSASTVPWGLDALGEKLQTLITHRGGDRTERGGVRGSR